MKKIVNLTYVLLVVFMLQSAFSYAANPKILVFSKTKGFFHTSIPIGMQTIMKICKENKINVGLECINADKISEFDSVFMTGTSPIVLPFNCIGNVVFSVRHPFLERLRNLYLIKAEESISFFRSE